MKVDKAYLWLCMGKNQTLMILEESPKLLIDSSFYPLDYTDQVSFMGYQLFFVVVVVFILNSI